MKNKQKKQIQHHYAKKNIEYYLDLIKKNKFPKYSKLYIREILRFTTGFNIRLKREEKINFCKKCLTPWNSSTRTIRFNKQTKTKNIICKNCGFTKRFPYK